MIFLVKCLVGTMFMESIDVSSFIKIEDIWIIGQVCGAHWKWVKEGNTSLKNCFDSFILELCCLYSSGMSPFIKVFQLIDNERKPATNYIYEVIIDVKRRWKSHLTRIKINTKRFSLSLMRYENVNFTVLACSKSLFKLGFFFFVTSFM